MQSFEPIIQSTLASVLRNMSPSRSSGGEVLLKPIRNDCPIRRLFKGAHFHANHDVQGNLCNWIKKEHTYLTILQH